MTFHLTPSDRGVVVKIILIYSLFGGLWIYLSDSLLGLLVRDPDIITRIATYKGLFFIVITATLLYYLVGRYVYSLNLSKLQLAERDQRFQAIFNSVSDAVFIHDAETGGIIDVNQTACELYCHTHAEMTSLDINALSLGVSPYSQREALDFLQRAVLGEAQTFDWHCRRGDGTLFWTEIRMRAAPIGLETRIIVSVRDISERMQADAQLRNHQALLAATIESLPFEFFAVDTSGRYIMQNAITLQHWGNVLGKRPQDLADDPFRIARWTENNARALDGESITQESRYELAEGVRHLLEILSPIRDCHGWIVGMLGINIDQSDQKNAEAALRESEKNLRALLELMPVGVSFTDGSGNIKYVNQNFIENFGYDPADIPTVEDWFCRAYPDAAYRTEVTSRWNAHILEHRQHGTPIPPCEVHVTCKDGSLRHVIINTQLSQSRVVVIFTDITDQENRRSELIKNQKLESIGVLAGGIAHDFNNILTGILGNVSYARMWIAPEHKSAKPLHEAERASKRAAELAQQLLTFAKGGQPVTRAVSLGPLIEESVSLVLHGSNVKPSITIQKDLQAIEADEGQISQVCNNLVLNAVQAMPGGGTISIVAENMTLDDKNVLSIPAGNYVRIVISDQGCGIPQENLQNIFDPYFTTKAGGTGLGLASVHSIISKHGGHISVRSAVGRGTTFEVLLPASTGKPARHISTNTVAGTSRTTETPVLVMDDEEMIRDLTSIILEELGYRVTTCADGQEAVDLYRAAFLAGIPFQAVIMDLTVPGGMGGKEAAGHVLEIDPAARLIVSSGYSNDPIVANYRDYGFCGVAIKPYTVNEIAGALDHLLSAPSERT